jgi:hypothetical protein
LSEIHRLSAFPELELFFAVFGCKGCKGRIGRVASRRRNPSTPDFFMFLSGMPPRYNRFHVFDPSVGLARISSAIKIKIGGSLYNDPLHALLAGFASVCVHSRQRVSAAARGYHGFAMTPSAEVFCAVGAAHWRLIRSVWDHLVS